MYNSTTDRYSMNTSVEAIEAVVAQLTAKGRETMTSVGRCELSFFDEGIVENSGIWGECLCSEMGHKSSGVVNQLKKLGLWLTSPGGEDDDSDWWSLTALGADVANYLAGRLEEAPVEAPAPTVKQGSKWTYIYAADGSLVAELRNDQYALIAATLAAL